MKGRDPSPHFVCIPQVSIPDAEDDGTIVASIPPGHRLYDLGYMSNLISVLQMPLFSRDMSVFISRNVDASEIISQKFSVRLADTESIGFEWRPAENKFTFA
jgi:hypothetical protein